MQESLRLHANLNEVVLSRPLTWAVYPDHPYMDTAGSSTETRPAVACRQATTSTERQPASSEAMLIGSSLWSLSLNFFHIFERLKSSTSPPRSEIQQRDQPHIEELALIFVGL